MAEKHAKGAESKAHNASVKGEQEVEDEKAEARDEADEEEEEDDEDGEAGEENESKYTDAMDDDSVMEYREHAKLEYVMPLMKLLLDDLHETLSEDALAAENVEREV